MIDLSTLSADVREEAAFLLANDAEFCEWARQLENAAYYNFKPRPDDPANFDQQSAYVNAADTVSFLLGGNACLAPDTPIFDPVAGVSRPVASLAGVSRVWARNMTTGRREVGTAGPAFCKGVMPRVRVTLSTGESFVCSESHRVLSLTGLWIRAADLQTGGAVFRSGIPQFDPFGAETVSLLGFPQDASRSFRRQTDSTGRYCWDRRRDGEPLRYQSNTGLESSPQLGGAREHSPLNLRPDALCIEQERSPLYRRFGPRSTLHCEPPALPSFAWQSPPACKPCLPAFDRAGILGQALFSNGPAILPSKVSTRFLQEFSPLARTTFALNQLATETLCDLSAWGTLNGRDCENAAIIAAVEPWGNGEVWDFTVWPNHNYEAAGTIHHNSGKTACSALKCAKFLLTTPPPRPDTPFWIVAQTYEQVGLVCWKEKLCDGGFLPRTEVEWDRISWRNSARGEPASVPLKPWPNDRPGAKLGCNWMLEFKSLEQGRAAMQARSIGGFWFSEQFPLPIFLEVLRGCRDYLYRGGQFAEFTPIDPDLCLWVEELMDNPPKGWGFYRTNTAANRPVLDAQAPDWFDQFFGAVPEEMLATRQTGALASFEGVIYQSFNSAVHVVDEDKFRIPDGAEHFMGTDWGASAEHPHATGFGCRDGMGDWYIYQEYWSPEQGLITLDHADKIIELADEWGWPTITRKDKRSGNSRLVLAGNDPNYGYNFADPSRPGEINEFNVHGIPTAPAINRVYDGINTIRSLLKVHAARGKPKLFISRRCKHLIDEIRKYRWLKGKRSTTGHSVLNPKVAAPQPLKRDDDSCDWLRYMCHSAEKSRGAGITSTDQLPEGIQRRSVKLAAGQAAEISAKTRAAGGHRASRPGWFERKG